MDDTENPIPESSIAKWLEDGEELYLPEVVDDGEKIISRRTSKSKEEKRGSGFSKTRMYYRDEGCQEGLGWDDFDRISSGIGVDPTFNIGVQCPGKVRLWCEKMDEVGDEEAYNASLTENIPKPPSRNKEAEQEAAACGRSLQKRRHRKAKG